MYVRDPLRVVVTGPLAMYAAGFCAELERQGYAAQPASELAQLMAHVSRWLYGQGLGPEYAGDLLVGAAITRLLGGQLWRLKLSGDRQEFVFSDPRLDDRVADNLDKYDLTESESLLFGQDFGIVTDIQTGPNGNLFVVSLSNGAVYEIFRP